MQKMQALTKAFAILGTTLVWVPLLAPVFLSAMLLVRVRLLRFDYLMPAELFPVALLGGALLLWSALLARSRPGLTGGGLAIAAGSLLSGQLLALVTGLASGESEPVGWRVTMVLASLAVYLLALLAMGVGGLLLLRDLLPPRPR